MRRAALSTLLFFSGCCGDETLTPPVCTEDGALFARVTHGDDVDWSGLSCAISVDDRALTATVSGSSCHNTQLIGRRIVYEERVPCALPALPDGRYTLNGVSLELPANTGLPSCQPQP